MNTACTVDYAGQLYVHSAILHMNQGRCKMRILHVLINYVSEILSSEICVDDSALLLELSGPGLLKTDINIK